MELTEHLSRAIEKLVREAVGASLKNRKQAAFFLKNIIAQKSAAKRREKYESEGIHIPPFLIASITSQCNLCCTGCYARANHGCSTKKELASTDFERIFREARELGISFILLAGGEPLMRREVIETAAQFPDIIFPVFTNGTMLQDEYIKLFDKHRNLLPVFSIEGDVKETDERRGEGTYEKLMQCMEGVKAKGIFYGTSITTTRQNLEEVTSGEYLEMLYEKGCRVVFYVEYVPVESSTAGLVLTPQDREYLAERQNWSREKYASMLNISFPGDEEDFGGCLAAGRGFFHINAFGDAEPCPFSPYSEMNLKEHSLVDIIQSGFFRKLQTADLLNKEHAGGCVLFEKADVVRTLLEV